MRHPPFFPTDGFLVFLAAFPCRRRFRDLIMSDLWKNSALPKVEAMEPKTNGILEFFGGFLFLENIPSRERIHIPPNGKRSQIIDSKVPFLGWYVIVLRRAILRFHVKNLGEWEGFVGNKLLSLIPQKSFFVCQASRDSTKEQQKTTLRDFYRVIFLWILFDFSTPETDSIMIF